MRQLLRALSALCTLACAPPLAQSSTPPPRAASSTPSTPPELEPVAAATPAPVDATPVTASLPPRPVLAPPNAALHETCGALECQRFKSAAEAFARVLATHPRAIGIGESHAQKGSEHVVPTARRFSEQLLPLLAAPVDAAAAGGASHLIVELLRPNPECVDTTNQVREAQRPVTQQHTATARDDYTELGHRAKQLGIEPFVLTPNCGELRAIAEANERAVEVSLTTIAQITDRMLRAALLQNQRAGNGRIVVAYGGALHNDESPAPARAEFSFGHKMSAFTRGQYVELDLIVREFIKDNEVWRALPWYAHFDAARYPAESVLMRTGPRSYVLFFPATP